MADKTLLIVGGIAVVAIGAYIFTRPKTATSAPVYYRPIPQTTSTATQIANDANAASSLVNATSDLIDSLNDDSDSSGASTSLSSSSSGYYGSDPITLTGVHFGAL